MLSEASTREDIPTLSNEKKRDSLKKVTFKLEKPLSCDDFANRHDTRKVTETKSLDWQ
jgi:hypothetical protein